MTHVVFIGTFDPLHGGHIGQLLRAYTYKPFTVAYILVDKHPAHKPHASDWKHRLAMAELTLSAFKLPFAYAVMAVDDSTASEIQEAIDYKVSGIDSLIDNLNDPQRWPLAQRWPMIVLSIPGVKQSELLATVDSLPPHIHSTIHYEYVSENAAPMMNYDFEQQRFISRRIHATHLRAGKENTLVPAVVQEYIRQHALYQTN